MPIVVTTPQMEHTESGGGSGAIKIGGSPFKMLAEAEEACDAILKHLTSDD
jgi:hypothetical protein